MIVAMGTDHRGFSLKQALIKQNKMIDWLDVGTHNNDRCNFAGFAQKVIQEIIAGKADCGVLLCGTGVGMSIVANRYKKIYAALAWNVETARLAKEHNNANILVIPADYVSLETARDMIKAWLEATYLAGHYAERITEIDAI